MLGTVGTQLVNRSMQHGEELSELERKALAGQFTEGLCLLATEPLNNPIPDPDEDDEPVDDT